MTLLILLLVAVYAWGWWGQAGSIASRLVGFVWVVGLFALCGLAMALAVLL